MSPWAYRWTWWSPIHYSDGLMSAKASQITSLMIVYSAIYSGADQKRHHSSASLAFVRGIHRSPVNSPHKGPVARKMFPFDDVIMISPEESMGIPVNIVGAHLQKKLKAYWDGSPLQSQWIEQNLRCVIMLTKPYGYHYFISENWCFNGN